MLTGYPKSTVAKNAISYGGEVGYNIGSFCGKKAPKIYPFVRYEFYSPMYKMGKGGNVKSRRQTSGKEPYNCRFKLLRTPQPGYKSRLYPQNCRWRRLQQPRTWHL